jgi:hypothetical protein
MCLLLYVTEIILLFPFLFYMFYLLKSEVVISRIMEEGLNNLAETKPRSRNQEEELKTRVAKSTEYLMNIATKAVGKKNKVVSNQVIDALCNFTVAYSGHKPHLSADWFTISDWAKQTQDFVLLSSDLLDQMSVSSFNILFFLETKCMVRMESISSISILV